MFFIRINNHGSNSSTLHNSIVNSRWHNDDVRTDNVLIWSLSQIKSVFASRLNFNRKSRINLIERYFRVFLNNNLPVFWFFLFNNFLNFSSYNWMLDFLLIVDHVFNSTLNLFEKGTNYLSSFFKWILFRAWFDGTNLFK